MAEAMVRVPACLILLWPLRGRRQDHSRPQDRVADDEVAAALPLPPVEALLARRQAVQQRQQLRRDAAGGGIPDDQHALAARCAQGVIQGE